MAVEEWGRASHAASLFGRAVERESSVDRFLFLLSQVTSCDFPNFRSTKSFAL